MSEASLDAALAVVGQWLRSDRLDEADAALQEILAQLPGQPDALHLQGLLRHAQGDNAGGIALIQQAVEVAPQAAGFWNNLGNLLLDEGRLGEAAEAYQRSVDLRPNQPEAHNNLATLHRRHSRWAEAEAAARRALAADPDGADAWYNLSLILLAQGRVKEGLEANSQAVLRWPRHLLAREQVLRALVLLGSYAQAAQLYRDWLAEEPDNPVVQHQLAACLQALADPDRDPPSAPSRASDAYVETLFDHFAGSFDAKLAQLHYRAPALVADAVRTALGEPRGTALVADLGCGTGLCGPLIRPWAARLAGCDLSVGMLRQARQRRSYDLLHKAELVYYLATQPGAFDLITCADTLCYLGDLQPVMQAARQALRPGGHFIFTVEGLEGPGFRLLPNGRYAHAATYVQDCAQAAGLQVGAMRSATLRDEAGEAVRGWVVTLQEPRRM